MEGKSQLSTDVPPIRYMKVRADDAGSGNLTIAPYQEGRSILGITASILAEIEEIEATLGGCAAGEVASRPMPTGLEGRIESLGSDLLRINDRLKELHKRLGQLMQDL